MMSYNVIIYAIIWLCSYMLYDSGDGMIWLITIIWMSSLSLAPIILAITWVKSIYLYSGAKIWAKLYPDTIQWYNNYNTMNAQI